MLPPMTRGQIFQQVIRQDGKVAYIDPGHVVFVEPGADAEYDTDVTLESGLVKTIKGNAEVVVTRLQNGRQMASELLLGAMIESIQQTKDEPQEEGN